jgi:hypothetical protein
MPPVNFLAAQRLTVRALFGQRFTFEKPEYRWRPTYRGHVGAWPSKVPRNNAGDDAQRAAHWKAQLQSPAVCRSKK